MSLMSRIGNPILSGFLNLVYRTPIGDAHCGLRAIRRDALPRLDLHSTGMEFASEMVIRAVRADLDIREQPIALHVRGGESKLSPLRDGWRHLRLMLVYSPGFLFFIPGAVMVALGLLIDRHGAGEADDLRPAVLHPRGDRRLAARHRRDRGDRSRPDRAHLRLLLHGRPRSVPRADAPPLHARARPDRGRRRRSRRGSSAASSSSVDWIAKGAGSLGQGEVALLAATVVVAGVQIFFASFVLSILGLRRPRSG